MSRPLSSARSCGCRSVAVLGLAVQRWQALRHQVCDKATPGREVQLGSRVERVDISAGEARADRHGSRSVSSSSGGHSSNLQVVRSRGEMVRERCSGE